MKLSNYSYTRLKLIVLIIWIFVISTNVNSQDTVLTENGLSPKDTIASKEILSLNSKKNSDFIVILDPAHGCEVPGKRSPAVLIETMFQDNKEDVEIMLSEEFKKSFAEMIVNAVSIFIYLKSK